MFFAFCTTNVVHLNQTTIIFCTHFVVHLAAMTVPEFLSKEGNLLNLSAVANAMWPKNKTARIYLDKKLRGMRKWSKKDDELALSVLKSLAVDISELTASIPSKE